MISYKIQNILSFFSFFSFRSKTLKANVAVSAPIMSRFDLFFVILDECNPFLDEKIAKHIVQVHREGGKQKIENEAHFTTDQLQRYIRYARTLNPVLTKECRPVLVRCYRLLRDNDILGKNKTAYRITVRQLESLIRLSEALARLHLDDLIRPEYVHEAYRCDLLTYITLPYPSYLPNYILFIYFLKDCCKRA
jgi:DNA replication licensing factor MCM6